MDESLIFPCSLSAYYVFIHPYFPILPPPISSPIVDRPLVGHKDEASPARDFEPSSPISLAFSAILALIPHPNEEDPSNAESVLYRRKNAQSFAESTMESIEIESEIMDSDSSPSRALSGSPSSCRRPPFHPYVPTEVESVQALCIMCIYEYTQRGNLNKMRSRAGQALVLAMDMSLHAQGDREDHFSEARSRAWWMCVSSHTPTIDSSNADMVLRLESTHAYARVLSSVVRWVSLESEAIEFADLPVVRSLPQSRYMIPDSRQDIRA